MEEELGRRLLLPTAAPLSRSLSLLLRLRCERAEITGAALRHLAHPPRKQL